MIAEGPSVGVVLPRKQKTAAAIRIPTPTEVGLILANAAQAEPLLTRLVTRVLTRLPARTERA